jgi:hypothetical protein
MQYRSTRLESTLPATPRRNFITFPLPLGDREYGDYMAKVRKRFPAGELRTVVRGGHEYTIGTAAALPVLFPVAATVFRNTGANRP